jgi:hypothetical protein
LSGEPNQPFSLVSGFHIAPTSSIFGSPHSTRIDQVPRVAEWLPPSSLISMMWPKLRFGRGLAASTCSGVRRELLVSMI